MAATCELCHGTLVRRERHECTRIPMGANTCARCGALYRHHFDHDCVPQSAATEEVVADTESIRRTYRARSRERDRSPPRPAFRCAYCCEPIRAGAEHNCHSRIREYDGIERRGDCRCGPCGALYYYRFAHRCTTDGKTFGDNMEGLFADACNKDREMAQRHAEHRRRFWAECAARSTDATNLAGLEDAVAAVARDD
jgi:hypothetical protein